MLEPKTHRQIRRPKISARYLADYMAASETARRTIIRNCKYQAIARVVQHDEAKSSISSFLRAGNPDPDRLSTAAQELRGRMTTSDFERDVLDHNADYIDRFITRLEDLELPNATRLPPGQVTTLDLEGVRVTLDLRLRFSRLTTTNRVRVGGLTLRYAKGRALAETVGEWQSALLFGYLREIGVEDGAEVERALCITLDAYSGVTHAAPSDSIRRFNNMTAACATISERWPNIAPPPGAVL